MTKKNALKGALLLFPVICSAALAETPLQEVPVAVTTITGDQLRDQGIASLDDLQNLVPNINFTTRGEGAADIDLRNLGSTRTVLINELQPRNRALSEMDQAAMDSLQRIEVLAGPQGTLFGRNATSGVVNLVTKDSYQGRDTNHSFVLTDLYRGLGKYRVSIESNGECDATNSTELPLWALNPRWNFGAPEFKFGGEQMEWGSVDDGYKQKSFTFPFTFLRASEYHIPPSFGGKYTKFNALVDRIVNYANASEFDKRDFLGMLLFGAALAGPSSISDASAGLSHFNPDQLFEEFKTFAENRTDADRTAFEESLKFSILPERLPAPAPEPKQSQGPTTPSIQQEPTTPSTPETPETPAEPKKPNPFDEYAYPPDYAFDFTQCTAEQKEKVLRLIRERDQGRADHSYYSDYMRRDGQSAEMVKEDMKNAAAALRVRDTKNQELREYWQSCTNPQPATSTAAVDPVEAEVPVIGIRGRFDATENWNLEVRLNYDKLLEGKSIQDIGLDLYDFDFATRMAWPQLSEMLERTKGSDAGSSRSYADENGVIRLEGAIEDPFGLRGNFRGNNGLKLNGATNREANGGATKFNYAWPGDISNADHDPFYVFGLTHDPSAASDGGVTFGARVRLDSTYRPTRSKPKEDSWRIGIDYDLSGMRGGPTVRLKYDYDPVDSVYQEFIPTIGGTGIGPDLRPQQLPENNNREEIVPQARGVRETLEYLDRRAKRPFRVGPRLFRTYTALESDRIDWSALDHLEGQTYWANNECGDSALPQQASGYLTGDQTSIKSVADQWAFEQVGLRGDEPLLDEFAKSVIVAVVDTGLDWAHVDIAPENIWHNEGEIADNFIDDDGNGFVDDIIGWNFMGDNNRPWDYDGHGTAVAGIIAATQGNDAGISGINGHAKIIVLKALNNFGRTRVTYVAQAIVYAADNGAQIVNLSVTGPGFPKIVQDAVNYAESKGVLVVNAAGNRAEDIDAGELTPLTNVLTVASTGADNNRAVFSNVGASVNIAAPGVDVVSLRARATDFMYNSGTTSYVKEDAFIGEDRRYYRATGTSFSAPIVTGVASLLLSNNPGLTPEQLRRILTQTARDVEVPGRDRYTGYGIVDARSALAANPDVFTIAEIAAAVAIEQGDVMFIEMSGSASADQFVSARLEIGAGNDPESWTAVGLPLIEAVNDGALGQIPLEQFAGDSAWTVRLLVENQNGMTREARYSVNLERPEAPSSETPGTIPQ